MSMTADEALDIIRIHEAHEWGITPYRKLANGEVEAAEAYLRLTCAVLAEVEAAAKEAWSIYFVTGLTDQAARGKCCEDILARARATVEREADHEHDR